eukprot:31778-Rhodomonas_salina.1
MPAVKNRAYRHGQERLRRGTSMRPVASQQQHRRSGASDYPHAPAATRLRATHQRQGFHHSAF